MQNQTHAFNLAQMTPCLMCFSKALPASGTVYIEGAGGQSGDGFPVPYSGFLTHLSLYDASTPLYHSDTAEITLTGNQRICLKAIWTGADYSVRVMLNNVNTALVIHSIPANVTILATVTFTQKFE